jgi:Glycosyltransferase family 87
MRAEARPPLARWLALALCVANPITLLALEVGHPEELLGACLCVAAVLLAARDRPLWAGLLLGLAIANKEWALLAAGPVLLALPARRRVSCSLAALLAAGIVLAPLALVQSGGFVGATRASASPASSIFQPWQLWWFFGHHGALVHGTFGEAKAGYRIGPAWTGEISHPLILAVGLLLSVALWLRARFGADGERNRRGAALDERTALLAFALIMLLRCVLDTWDTAYYALPFLLALLAWELTGLRARPPLLALACTALAWLSFHWLAERASADLQAAVFLAWTLPLAAALALRLFAPRRALLGSRSPTPGAGAREALAAHEMTVKPFSRPLSTS